MQKHSRILLIMSYLSPRNIISNTLGRVLGIKEIFSSKQLMPGRQFKRRTFHKSTDQLTKL